MSNEINKTKILNIHTDGGSRGNPGLAALGVYIENDLGEVLAEIGKTLGITTNNIAEYSAIVAGLSWVLENKKDMPSLSCVSFYMDSNLVMSQLNGLYKIKNANLRELFFIAKQKEAEIKIPISYAYVPREENKDADRLVNLALDNKL